MVGQGGNSGAEGHDLPQGLGLGFRGVTAAAGIKTDPVNIPNDELEAAFRGNAAVVGGVKFYFIFAGGKIGQLIALRRSNVFIYQNGVVFIDMQKERTGILGQIPAEFSGVLLDIFGLVGSQGGGCGRGVVRFNIGRVDVASFAVVFYIGPAAGHAQHMDDTTVDNTADIVIAAAVAGAEQAIFSGNINLVVAVGGLAAAWQTAGAAGNIIVIAGIDLLAAGGAGPVGGMGVGGILAFGIGLSTVTACIIRRTEIILAGQPPVGHDIQALTLRGIGVIGVVNVGIAFRGIEVVTVHGHDDTHMGEDLGEEDVAGLGGVGGTVMVGNVEITGAGVSHCAEADNRFGKLRLGDTPGNKGGAPGLVCRRVPGAVLGIVVDAFGIANLGQRNTHQIHGLVTGVDICIRVVTGCRVCGSHPGQQASQQGADRQEKGENTSF